jgi:site-specific DNA recombinase
MRSCRGNNHRELFEAVREKSFAQWSHRTVVRNKSDHLLAGLLFDDAGHRMIPTHATKAGIRYRYYASTPVLIGEAKTASAGSVSRVPAADIEDTVLKSLEAHFAAQQDGLICKAVQLRDHEALVQLVAGIVVHTDKLIVRLKSDHTDEEPERSVDPSLTIAWQKPPSKRSRRILLPHNVSRRDVQPEQFERRVRLVSTIANGRRWLDEVITGRVTTVQEICIREKCSVRHVNMTISLAFLAPNLVKAAIEGRLPRGIGSSGSEIRRLNGATSSRPSDSIRNNNLYPTPTSRFRRRKNRNFGREFTNSLLNRISCLSQVFALDDNSFAATKVNIPNRVGTGDH